MKQKIATFIDVELMQPHNPLKFKDFYDGPDANSFRLRDGTTYILDSNGGWSDENGCYYNADGQPSGWFVDEYFYNQYGQYVPSDEDVSSLPKQNKVDITNKVADKWGCYNEGQASYNSEGEHIGFLITKADGNDYFFSTKGQYIERDIEDLKNDLEDYDLGEVKRDYMKTQILVQSQAKPRPQKQVKNTGKPSQTKSIQATKPAQSKQPITQKSESTVKVLATNVYTFELSSKELAKEFAQYLKSCIDPAPKFELQDKILTVKCVETTEYLDQDEIEFDTGKVAKRRR